MLVFVACGSDDTPIDEYCWNQASDYTIITENTDGSVIVTLIAPDYAQLIQNILLENSYTKVSVKSLSDAIKASPDTVKEYVISANSTDEATIKAAFNDQIAKELVIAAISRTETKEEWGDGQ